MKKEESVCTTVLENVSLGASSAGATLHLVCGKIASGKSTLTSRLAKMPDIVLINEDDLLATLYPGKIQTLADYVRCTTKLKSAIEHLVRNILRAGDFSGIGFSDQHHCQPILDEDPPHGNIRASLPAFLAR